MIALQNVAKFHINRSARSPLKKPFLTHINKKVLSVFFIFLQSCRYSIFRSKIIVSMFPFVFFHSVLFISYVFTFFEYMYKYCKILISAHKHGLSDCPEQVANLISHATQERLRNIIEKLSVTAEHRLEIYKVRHLVKCSYKVLTCHHRYVLCSESYSVDNRLTLWFYRWTRTTCRPLKCAHR